MIRDILPGKWRYFFYLRKKDLIGGFKKIRYLSIPAFGKAVAEKYVWIRWGLKPAGKRILWIGAFPPRHSNLGDHAQTLAVEKFFQEKFQDYQVIKLLRNEIDGPRWNKLTCSIQEDDLIFIHSSGDFGSRYHRFTEKDAWGGHHPQKNSPPQESSWHDIRKKIIDAFPKNRVIQLPTTVYYESNEKGRKTQEEDRRFYSDKNFLVLCREPESTSILSKSAVCESCFFPDFVFYLKPKRISHVRKGGLIVLREDSESKFSQAEKDRLIDATRKIVPSVFVKNIQKAPFSMTPMVLENYLNEVFRIYQRYQFVITDFMHGMIFAVINKTPCIAFDGAIPHKVGGYKEILSRSVKFAKNEGEIPALIKEILCEPYHDVCLDEHFDNFRKNILKEKKYESG